MYQIIIGDDDERFLRQAAEQVRRIMTEHGLEEGADYELFACPDPTTVQERLCAEPDRCGMLLLDVDFAGQNGIEMAKALRQSHVSCGLIYLTSYRDFVFDCFETKPISYLLKPVDWEKFAGLLIRDYREHYAQSFLGLKIAGRQISVPYREIYVMEAVSHHVRLYLANDRVLEWNGSLSGLEKEISGGCFCKCHNSFLINLEHVSELLKTEVKMDDGRIFPVSRRFYGEALKRYFGVLRG